MDTTTTDEKAQAAAPYVSFPSFTNLLDWLSTVGTPLQMDRSFWGSKFSGAVGGQLMSALRFLGLLIEDKPTSELEELVRANAEARKKQVALVLKTRYSAIFELGDLYRLTPKQISDALQEHYRVSGDTARKAQSFFINACKYANIPLSSTLRKQARIRRSGKPRQKPKEKPPEPRIKPPSGQSQNVSQSRTVNLRSGGGTVELVVSFDPFTLSDKDRGFVFGLIDKLKDYEQADEKEAAEQ
jgi:hypothetical protein